MKRKMFLLATILGLVLLPGLALAAGGKSSELVVVADTRVLSGWMLYFADLYNTNIVLFALWATVLTAMYGAFLGFLMDFIMSRTGLDLTSRKIVEH
ncbi:MAG: DVU0150 family protein [Desulfovibrio sp.]